MPIVEAWATRLHGIVPRRDGFTSSSLGGTARLRRTSKTGLLLAFANPATMEMVAATRTIGSRRGCRGDWTQSAPAPPHRQRADMPLHHRRGGDRRDVGVVVGLRHLDHVHPAPVEIG